MRMELITLLKEFKDCFAWHYHKMPGLDRSLVEHRLPIKEGYKPASPIRRIEWLANIVPVLKKVIKAVRVCVDYRNFNEATPKDEYLMPMVDMLINSVAHNKILSFMDGNTGYNQIMVAEADIHKTAFRCLGAVGAYEYIVMPFGLKNAGATYQSAMNAIFHDMIWHTLEVCIHDVVIKSQEQEAHIEDLRKVFIRMHQHQLKMNPKKCAFATKKKPQSLLRKINFLRRFIANSAGKVQPFSPLLKIKQGDPFAWGPIQQEVLDQIKLYLTKPPVLMPPKKALSEFSFRYVPQKAVKGQAIANFLAPWRLKI
ncbi:unnamed protein product [Prunus brigantina]